MIQRLRGRDALATKEAPRKPMVAHLTVLCFAVRGMAFRGVGVPPTHLF